MAVAKSYAETTIREDLSDVVDMISPTETPFISMIGRGKATNAYHEWSKIDLEAASDTNAAVEGADAPTATHSIPTRLGNYRQISTKTASIAGSQAYMKTPAGTNRMKKQISMRIAELKRDMEKQLLSNKASSAGSASGASICGSFSTWLETNTSRAGDGDDGGFSSGTTSAPTDGTQRAFTETLLKSVIASCWDAGATPKYVLVGAYNKEKASTFTGNATRYRENTEAKKLIAAVDVYVSDFGEVQIVPDRFTRTRDAYVIDPKKVKLIWCRNMQNFELARTGDAQSRQVLCEYTLEVCNEAAHGVVADLTTSG